ncbi:MAG: hypothetical protein JSV23_08620 [Promethearchaeota archaeon]|nr:MAG: hypothetical protein JSV23_08620 [Candidatus Lokiarchaeota archaeon]
MTINNEAPKKKLPKKELRILKKKTIIGFGIVAAVAVAGIIGGIYLFSEPPKYSNLIIGTNWGIWQSLDPLNTNVPTDYDITCQIAEGLFDYAMASDGSLVIHNLAINHSWSIDYLNLSCNLRQGVKFHDGTTFNAAAVKWNFDRIYNLIDLNKSHKYDSSFWLFSDGKRIINETKVINDYTVCFILNKPYIPFPAVLASVFSYILSPNSTPFNDVIPIDGGLVGTGPFIYDDYIMGEKILLSSNPSYWGGQPKINKLIYLILDRTARYDALLSGDVSMLNGYNQLYNPDPDAIYYDDAIDVYSFFNDTSLIIQEGPPAFHFTYLIINNKLVPVEMREAISYALNYSYIIQEAINGHGVRHKSPIPEGMLYSNLTGIDYPYYNISKARQALKDAGWPGTTNLTANDDISPGNEWEMLVTNNTALETYNYTCVEARASELNLLFYSLFAGDLKQIGVKIELANITRAEWSAICKGTGGYHLDMINFIIMGFNGPRLNDPSHIIQTLYFSRDYIGHDNFGQVNDTLVEQWIEQALEEPDEKIRSQIYYDIQKRLTEEVFPTCYLYRKNYLSIFRSNLKGWEVHQFKSNFKNIYFE